MTSYKIHLFKIVSLFIFSGFFQCELSANPNDILVPETTLASGKRVNASAWFWSKIVKLPFFDDVTVETKGVPLDFNRDGIVDLVSREKIELPNGLLANRKRLGWVATPEDPKGTLGETSISSGFLGVREAYVPGSKKPSGR
jgi:hypothetical protein